MKILFRCDGGAIPQIGTGHIVRCLIIAQQLRKDGHTLGFAIKHDRHGLEKITESGFSVYCPSPGQKESSWIKQVMTKFKPDVAVVDCLRAKPSIMRLISELNSMVISIDDAGPGARFADLCVNAMVEKGRLGAYHGYEYITLPPRMISKKNISAECRKIFLSFGGYDHKQVAQKTLKALRPSEHKAEFVVVASAASAGKFKNWNLPISRKGRVRFLFDSKDFDNELESSDLAILSGGLSLYQALSSGIPSIVISQYDHQLRNAKSLEKLNAVVNLGLANQVRPDKIRKVTSSLCTDLQKRSSLSATGQALVDRGGARRMADLIQIVKELSWDTNYFGIPIARLYPSRINERILRFALNFCRQKKIKCLYYLANSQDSQSVRLAEQHGFHLVDVRLSFSVDLAHFSGSQNTGRNLVAKSTLQIRNAIPEDIPHLRKIARQSYSLSRYYYDPHFSREKCHQFYADWIQKSCQGGVKKVLVADWEGRPVGFITCDLDSPRKGSIYLVGVLKNFFGRGIASLLVHRGLEWFKSESVQSVAVVTQARNCAAQKLYQRCGFTTSKTELWYHKWF